MPWQVVGFALGVFLLQQVAVLPAPTLLAALGLLGLPAWLASRKRYPMLAAIVALMLGFFWAGMHAHWRMADRLPVELEGRDIEIVGRVHGLPQRFERGLRFVFETEPSPERLPSRIALSWYRQVDSWADDESGEEAVPPAGLLLPRAGERWRFVVRLKRPHGAVNPHGFDYEGWLFERGIGATGYVRKSGQTARLDQKGNSLSGSIDGIRERIRQRIFIRLDGQPLAGVVAALSIGDQQAISQSQWQLFAATGITHLMSISGLHVTMLGALLAALAARLWRCWPPLLLLWPVQKVAATVGLSGAAVYALLSGFGVPAQRTLYMLAMVVLAVLSGRSLSAGRVLGAALLVVLLVDPWAVLAAGFWLSFGAVCLLFFVASRADIRRHWFVGWLRAQWALLLGLIPLLLALFQQFSLVSPLANALAIPLVSLLVTPLAIVGGVPGMDWALPGAHALLVPLMDFLNWLAGLPGALWQQHAPPAWTVPVGLAGAFWLLLPRGMPARWIGLPLMLPLFFLPPARPAPGELLVRVLDVGQGLAVHVQTAGHDLVYDTGPDYGGASDAGSRILLPYLRSVGVPRLNALVVSHADRDHAGGLDSLRGGIAADNFLTSMTGDRWSARRCIDGETWEWDGVRFAILHPLISDYERRLSSNAMSCVLRIESAHGSVLLPGDLEGAAEAQFLARHGRVVRSDILVAPHHGGRKTSSPELLAAVAPQEVVFSAGYRNRFGHPWPAVEERYRQAGVHQHRTDRDGAVDFHLEGAGIRIEQERERWRRYWHLE